MPAVMRPEKKLVLRELRQISEIKNFNFSLIVTVTHFAFGTTRCLLNAYFASQSYKII